MTYQEKLLSEFTVEELDRELIARGAQIPGDKKFKFRDREGTPDRNTIMGQVKELYNEAAALSPNIKLGYISTPELVETLILKTRQIRMNDPKGIWLTDDRLDYYQVTDEAVKKNAHCTAAICLEKNLIEKKNGFSTIRVKNYGKAFNLCECEPFHYQPVSAGWMCTGFLVKEDIIATAAHCANENNVKDLRIVFGYKISAACTPAARAPNENIYKGVEIIGRTYTRSDKQPDWALVRLDRKVEGQAVAKLSRRSIYHDQPVYVIGHPAGLPLKIAPGAQVCDIDETCFVANLDIYGGNSGSPVFCGDTHEVIGIVVRGYNRNFRWTGNGWLSVRYPNFDIPAKGPQCTRVSEFIAYLEDK